MTHPVFFSEKSMKMSIKTMRRDGKEIEEKNTTWRCLISTPIKEKPV